MKDDFKIQVLLYVYVRLSELPGLSDPHYGSLCVCERKRSLIMNSVHPNQRASHSVSPDPVWEQGEAGFGQDHEGPKKDQPPSCSSVLSPCASVIYSLIASWFQLFGSHCPPHGDRDVQKAGMVPSVTVFLPESPRGGGYVWGRGHLLTLRIKALTPCKLLETSSVQGQMQR